MLASTPRQGCPRRERDASTIGSFPFGPPAITHAYWYVDKTGFPHLLLSFSPCILVSKPGKMRTRKKNSKEVIDGTTKGYAGAWRNIANCSTDQRAVGSQVGDRLRSDALVHLQAGVGNL